MHDVFISHSSVDKAVADAICHNLESRGIRCWIAPRDVPPGAEFEKSIIDAIGKSRVFVLIFSSHSNGSHHVENEVRVAWQANVPILPFRIEDVQFSAVMNYYIGSRHWIDALTPPLEAQINRLINTTVKILNGPESGIVNGMSNGNDLEKTANIPSQKKATRGASKLMVLIVGVLLLILLAGLAYVILNPPAAPGLGGNSTLPSVNTIEPGKLKVATEAAFAPFTMINEKKELDGFDIDLIKEVGKELGLEVEITNMMFEGIIPTVNSGLYDCGISGMTITDERWQIIDYTEPYYTSKGVAILFRSDRDDITRTADLYGKHVGVLNGSLEESIIMGQTLIRPKSIIPYIYITHMLPELDEGVTDALLFGYPLADYYAKSSNGKYRVASGYFEHVDYYGIIVSKNNPVLTERINTAIAGLKADGRYQTIYMKWFGEDSW
jgi:polar amino acid transport system substrate-binding protein